MAQQPAPPRWAPSPANADLVSVAGVKYRVHAKGGGLVALTASVEPNVDHNGGGRADLGGECARERRGSPRVCRGAADAEVREVQPRGSAHSCAEQPNERAPGLLDDDSVHGVGEARDGRHADHVRNVLAVQRDRLGLVEETRSALPPEGRLERGHQIGRFQVPALQSVRKDSSLAGVRTGGKEHGIDKANGISVDADIKVVKLMVCKHDNSHLPYITRPKSLGIFERQNRAGRVKRYPDLFLHFPDN
jgi:hypothetical protein